MCASSAVSAAYGRAAIIGLVMLTIIAVAAAVIAVLQRQEANRQRNEAITRGLVSEAQSSNSSTDSLRSAGVRLCECRREGAGRFRRLRPL
jgi:hypothetical protein